MAAQKFRCLLYNAKEIVQVTSDPNVERLCGSDMSDIKILKGSLNGYGILLGPDGRIFAVDDMERIRDISTGYEIEHEIDVTGKVLVPGFIDAHTHPVWAGDRVHEFAMKLAGASYMEVHEAGGGIHFTVEKTRAATEDELCGLFKERLDKMLKCGTTVVEAKSGYGLDTENELKMLRVIQRGSAERRGLQEISGTYCGAHAIPKGKSSAEATEDVIKKQIPAIKAVQTEMSCLENIDVFCEKGVFDVAKSREILQEGRNVLGLTINFHAEELSCIGGGELAGELSARAASHLEELSEAGIEAMKASGTVPVLLPSTAYMLRLKSPPLRAMIRSGLPIALGSDFNPNAYCYSMPLIMHLACVLFGMSLEEALVASTINAAASLGRGRTHGALAPGRVGDVLVLNAPKWEHLIYQFGCVSELIQFVIKEGNIVHQATDHLGNVSLP